MELPRTVDGEKNNGPDVAVHNVCIDILYNLLDGMELKSFPILPVKVYSNCDSLTVNGKETKQTVFNDFEKVRKYYGTKNNSELTEEEKVALKKELRYFHKHLD